MDRGRSDTAQLQSGKQTPTVAGTGPGKREGSPQIHLCLSQPLNLFNHSDPPSGLSVQTHRVRLNFGLTHNALSSKETKALRLKSGKRT